MIVARPHIAGFTVVENECLLDARITPEALGMLCYIRSKDKITPEQLVKRFRVDRETVDQIIKELDGLGYIAFGSEA